MRLEETEIKYKGRMSVGDGGGGALDLKKKERKTKSVNVRECRFTPTC